MADNFKNILNGINLEPLSADPSNPKEGDFQFADGTARAKGLWVYQDGAWSQAGGSGGGGLDVFYSEDFETSVSSSDFTTGNNATFDNGGTLDGTLADETTSEIAGTTSLKYTMGSTSANDWVKSPNIAIDDKQSGNTVGLEFYYTYNGDDGDIKVVAWDDTGSTVMNLATDTLKAASNPQRFSVQFPIPSSTTSINWGFQVVTGNSAKVLIIDDVQISTNPFVAKNLVQQSDWKTYTPTLSAGFGTTSNESFFYRRLGDSIEIMGYFTAGTVAASLCSFSLPTGLSVDTTKLTISGNTTAAEGTLVGFWEISETASNTNGKLITAPGTDATLIYFGQSSINAANGLIPANGNSIMASGTDQFLKVVVPISGWTSEMEQIIAYNSRNAENSMVRLHTGNGYGSTNTVIPRFTTAVTNTGNAITYTDSATDGASFTINEDGIYYIAYSLADSTQAYGGISLNSSQLTTSITGITAADRLAVSRQVGVGDNGFVSWSGLLSKGDVVRPHNASTGTNTSATINFTIAKIGVGDLLGVPKPRTAYVKDVKSSGTAGGTFTSGAWQTRDLNTLEGDTEFVSLSSNQFTLSEGKYEIEAIAQAYAVDKHAIKLRNTTDSTDDIIGGVTFSDNLDGGHSNNSVLKGQIDITSSKTFEIQHRSDLTQASNGFGLAFGVGVSEIYCQVKITKIA